MTDDDDDRRTMLRRLVAIIFVLFFLPREPIPQHNSIRTGAMLYQELIDTRSEPRFRTDARMDKPTFLKLRGVLVQHGGLKDGRRICAGQKIFIFLSTLTGFTTRQTAATWQHSNSTVDEIIHEVANSLNKLSKRFFFKPEQKELDQRFARFSDACGALDGSHIPAVVPANEAPTFRNRKHFISQNVFACCNFDLTFNFAHAGWEGSSHDSQVLADAIDNGFTAPPGKYFLADAGYALSKLCLTPYRGVRYHLKEWRLGNTSPQNKEELYNLRHSSLRNVVERIFGVVKKRFPILVNMHSFDFPFQVHLVMACFMIHNFIRKEQGYEDQWHAWSVEEEEEVDPTHENANVEVDGNDEQQQNDLKAWRNGIAQSMWDDYQAYMQLMNVD